jgi:hypothetical protein
VRFGALTLVEGRPRSSLETSFDVRSTSVDVRSGAQRLVEGAPTSSTGPAVTQTGVDSLLGALRLLDVDL